MVGHKRLHACCGQVLIWIVVTAAQTHIYFHVVDMLQCTHAEIPDVCMYVFAKMQRHGKRATESEQNQSDKQRLTSFLVYKENSQRIRNTSCEKQRETTSLTSITNSAKFLPRSSTASQ